MDHRVQNGKFHWSTLNSCQQFSVCEYFHLKQLNGLSKSNIIILKKKMQFCPHSRLAFTLIYEIWVEHKRIGYYSVLIFFCFVLLISLQHLLWRLSNSLCTFTFTMLFTWISYLCYKYVTLSLLAIIICVCKQTIHNMNHRFCFILFFTFLFSLYTDCHYAKFNA